MTGRLIRFVLILSLLAAFNVNAATSVPVIVKLAPGVNISRITSMLGATVLDSIPGADTYLLRLPSLPVVTPALQLLGVQWIETNRGLDLPSVVHAGLLTKATDADPNWYKNQPAFQVIRSEAAHKYSDGHNVLIADINSQVDTNHPALVGHLFSGYDFVSGTSTAALADMNDQQTLGFLDDQQTLGFLDDQQTLGFLDDQQTLGFLDKKGLAIAGLPVGGLLDGHNAAYSHGTLCAGILASVAPGAMIMPIRAFDDNGNGDVFTLAKAIRWATQHHAQVINMSFGAQDNTSVMREAVAYAQKQGVILVASAGNDNTATPQYPAAYPGVIAVAATTLTDQKASFSNFGSAVDVDAPGVDIISAYPGGGYAMASGTSFSSPEVAGEVALILQMKATGIDTTVEGAAVNIDSKNPSYAGKLGYGRVDVLRAVQSR